VEDVLREIVAARRRRYGAADSVAAPPPGVPHPAARNPFLSALRARAGRAVVAEVKLGSPRLGSLVGRVDPELQAELYGRVGASALSVVVEPDFFFGSWELLARAKAASGLPALAKDFLVSPRQVDEAARAGADALLLVAALYDAAELGAWAARIRSAGMAPLVEIHAEAELRRLERAGGGWELVGVNARDLRDFSVDLGRSARLAPRLPAGALRVAESGISGRGDLDRLAAAGFDAFLVGESLLLADDPAARLAELVA
jgi:indole-3-glycerol phosphate synthase